MALKRWLTRFEGGKKILFKTNQESNIIDYASEHELKVDVIEPLAINCGAFTIEGEVLGSHKVFVEKNGKHWVTYINAPGSEQIHEYHEGRGNTIRKIEKFADFIEFVKIQ